MNQWTSFISQKTSNIEEFVNRSLDRQVKLAVTGLSRSGKTVFITSLIHQLMHGLDSSHLPFFEIASSGRLRGTRLMPQPNMHIPAFRYLEGIERLCSEPPDFPEATQGISEIRLAIRYESSQPVLKYVAPIKTLHIDIVDYPGEWLLDLPLLELSYEQWSEQIARLCEREPRFTLSQAWREYLDSIDFSQPCQDAVLRQASELYTDFLYACKKPEYGLSLLQPGHFTMPGDKKGAPILQFCPLLKIPSSKPEGSLFAEMKRRYEAYKEHVVRVFYREHFASFDRQIVLVDPLRAFNVGYNAFAEMQSALNMVLQSFHYAKTGIINKLFGGLKIDKVLFAATKADHVTPNQLNNLEQFLRQMLIKPQKNLYFDSVQTDAFALASIKCTQAAYTQFDGQRLSCIKGVPKDGDKPIALFPGEIPVDIPVPEDWVEGRFNFVEFKPPRLSNAHSGALPHIRLDRALEFLLGDKF